MSEKNGFTLDPNSERLLVSIVELVNKVFGAAAASIATMDIGRQLLEFKVASGEGTHEIVGKTIPLDTGIAGYVITTGKPLTIRDVHQDVRFHHSFAEGIGYVPTSILAIPLLWGGDVIGVLEVLDDTYLSGSELESMELLEMFARQASLVLVKALHQERSTLALLEKILTGGRYSSASGERDPEKTVDTSEHIPSESELGEISQTFEFILSLNREERRMMTDLLKGIHDFIQAYNDQAG